MKQKSPALPDLISLPDLEKRIYDFILTNWPTTPLELAENFNESVSTREEKKRASTKYSYYLKKLLKKHLIVSKKAGNSVIVWPLVVEKYRAIHDILKHHEAEHLILLNSSQNEVKIDA